MARALRVTIVGFIITIFLVLGGICFIGGASGIGTALTGKHVDGMFVSDDCRGNLRRGETSAFGCSGTFTPKDTALKPVYLGYSGGSYVRSSHQLTAGAQYESYAVVSSSGKQPEPGVPVVIVGDSQSKNSTIFLSIILLIVGGVFLWAGIALVLSLLRKRKSKPTKSV